MHGKKRDASEWSPRSPGGLSVLASAVGGLLTRTLVSSQVECVTENASVYSFYMLMWLLCDFKAKLFFFFFFGNFQQLQTGKLLPGSDRGLLEEAVLGAKHMTKGLRGHYC